MANKMSKDQLKEMCENARKLGMRSDRLMMLDERLTEWSQNEKTPAIAVRILRHGEVAFEAAYGPLGPDKEPDSLTVDTIFPICSITKPVISVLLSILQEEGLIDLNNPVRTYLPEFTGDENSTVRVWHLLTHTSGLIESDLDKNFADYVKNTLGLKPPTDGDPGRVWNEAFAKIREKMDLPYKEPGHRLYNDTYLTIVLSYPPTHKPQQVMSYCNTGFLMAARIIERISGKLIDEYAAEKLFGPLQMNDSHFIFPKSKLPRYVQRAEKYVGSWWLNKGVLNSEHGGGGLKSTVCDMTRFGQMFLNKGKLDGVRVLSPASVREITADHNSKMKPAEYNGELFDSTWGLGWNIRGAKSDNAGRLRSPISYEHGGYGCCSLICDPEADIVAARFTVSLLDDYWNLSFFYNMVMGAVDE